MKSFLDFLLEGKNNILHHMNNINNIDKFHPLSHFGSYYAAKNVGSQLHGSEISTDKENVPYRDRIHYRVRFLNKGKIFHLPEDIVNHEPHALIDALHKHGLFSNKEKEQHISKIHHLYNKHGYNSIESKEYVGNAIRDKGFHTVSYKNEFEHPGSKSYIITHPSQVHIIKKTPVKIKSSSYTNEL